MQELADHRPATVGFVEELDRKRCERPFREDGCGGMSETRLVF